MLTVTANLIGGLKLAVPLVCLAAREELFNPEFLSAVNLTGGALDFTHVAIIIGVIASIGWDVATRFVQARRSDEAGSAADRELQTVR